MHKFSIACPSKGSLLLYIDIFGLLKEVGHVRIRQNVNPLRSTLMIPVELPDWSTVYDDPELPLMVDKLAKRAEHWVTELALRNIHLIFSNATISFKQHIAAYPGPLVLVSILCPDPHFKKKHHKRRVLQKPLVESIVDCLVPGGQVLIQSDVLEVAEDMRSYFETNSDKLIHIDRIDLSMPSDYEGWLLGNPMGIKTEREIHAEFEGARIYRRMYQKQG